MDSKALEELRNKYIKNPPEGMTAKLVKGMTDSDLLDMHYFLTEDDDWYRNSDQRKYSCRVIYNSSPFFRRKDSKRNGNQ